MTQTLHDCCVTKRFGGHFPHWNLNFSSDILTCTVFFFLPDTLLAWWYAGCYTANGKSACVLLRCSWINFLFLSCYPDQVAVLASAQLGGNPQPDCAAPTAILCSSIDWQPKIHIPFYLDIWDESLLTGTGWQKGWTKNKGPATAFT